MKYPAWPLPAIGGGIFLARTEFMARENRPLRLRLSVLLVLLLILLGADREASGRPLVDPGVPGKPGAEQVLAAYLTDGFFGSRAARVRGSEPSKAADRLLFEQNCTLCHTADLVKERTAGWSRSQIRTALDQLNRLHPAMPDYRGTPQEKDRLADYIYLLNNAKPESGPER